MGNSISRPPLKYRKPTPSGKERKDDIIVGDADSYYGYFESDKLRWFFTGDEDDIIDFRNNYFRRILIRKSRNDEPVGFYVIVRSHHDENFNTLAILFYNGPQYWATPRTDEEAFMIVGRANGIVAYHAARLSVDPSQFTGIYSLFHHTAYRYRKRGRSK